MKQGKLIVIDGSDGSGKKTQSEMLINNLRDLGHGVAFYDFPQYADSFFGRMVGRYLNGEFGDVDDVSPYLASILYAGDRFEASNSMKIDLEACRIVICNRYIQSNMAFQTAKLPTKEKKKEFLNWVEEMEYDVFKIPKADLVIYLHVPHKVSQELVGRKAERNYTKLKHDIHEKNSDYLAKVEVEYVNLSKTNPRWRLIDCMKDGQIRTREEIAQKVLGVVKGELLTEMDD